MDYLTRYLNGEHEQVWQELIDLGGAIREGELYVQAEAVARETMRRVRKNVETLIERLHELKYNFNGVPLTVAKSEWTQEIKELEQELGPLPLSLRIFYEEVGAIDFMGWHPKLSEFYGQPDYNLISKELQSLYQKYLGEGSEIKQSKISSIDLQSLKWSFQYLQELSRDITGKIAPIRARKVEALAKELATQLEVSSEVEKLHLEIDTPDVYADPLVVYYPIHDLWYPEDYLYYDAQDETSRIYSIDFAPDPTSKANYSGGGPTSILFPNEAIDGKVMGSVYFVNDLRDSIKWGGFPGFRDSARPPMDEINFLTKDLLPF